MAKSLSSHESLVTANAAAATVSVVYVICALSFVLAPEFAMEITTTWFHKIDISRMDARTVTAGSFLLGLISSCVAAWLTGYLFATLYTFFAKK